MADCVTAIARNSILLSVLYKGKEKLFLQEALHGRG
jgi:hypothetical protein